MARDFSNLPTWLPKQLQRKGWSVEMLANRTGVSRTAIYFWLYDTNRPTEEIMAAVCRALEVPLEEGLRQYIPKPKGRPAQYDDPSKRSKRKRKK